ncbi:phenylalanine--tRNA ligase subunit beta [Candidatus Omnitrophota bacterium]
MKLSYSWLKEYVDINAGPEELANGLTMSGSEVGEMKQIEGDTVMDLEITSNRPDCLNIIGLAREASAVFDKDLRTPAADIPEAAQGKEGPQVECVIKSKKLCPRYTARIISDVKVKSVSGEIRKHINALGLREVNNIVDITNFCLMEQGQPLHAFDLDKIKGGKVVIREAAKGEKIVTIDEEERKLEPGMLVIADAERPIAIAGVMGGKDTEVTESTRNILLESAYFDPVSVRRTAHKLGLSSDSSYRFERGVDKGRIKTASDRAAELIAEEAKGSIGRLYDVGALAVEKRKIKFNTEKAEKILGVGLEKENIKRIFTRLGMSILKEDGSEMLVEVPTFREDLEREVDLVEEAARIVGYHNIPSEITKYVPQVTRKEHSRKVLEKMRATLPSLGLNEIMTYSLVSEEAIKTFPSITQNPVELQNPVSEEHKIMVPHLLDGMLRSISWNINRGNKDLGLFEVAKIYSQPKGKGRYIETPTLCIGLTGMLRRNWQEGERETSLFDLKGVVEAVLRGFKCSAEFNKAEAGGLDGVAELTLFGEGESIGFIGEVSRKVLAKYDIEQQVYVCQIKLDKIIEKTVLLGHYHAIPRFPSSTRDVSILCEQTLAAGDILKAIKTTGEEIIRSIELADVYQGEQIGAGQKSITCSIEYGLDTRTLKDEEIEGMHSRIKDAIARKFKVTFR